MIVGIIGLVLFIGIIGIILKFIAWIISCFIDVSSEDIFKVIATCFSILFGLALIIGACSSSDDKQPKELSLDERYQQIIDTEQNEK